MEESNQELTSQVPARVTLTGELGRFCIKTAIVLGGIFILISLLLPDLDEVKGGLKQFETSLKRFETPKSKLLVLSLVQNPVALWKISEIEEAEGHTASAIREMELAIGLLEMHGADKQIIKKYTDRVAKLKAIKS